MGLVTRIIAYCDGQGCYKKILTGHLEEYVEDVLTANGWHIIVSFGYAKCYCSVGYANEDKKEDIK